MLDKFFPPLLPPLFYFLYFVGFFLWAETDKSPLFIVKSSIFESLKADLKIRPDAYFLVKGLNSEKRLSLVFFDDLNKKIYYMDKGKIVWVNSELGEEGENFTYLSRGVDFDGKFVYIYGSVKYGKPKYVFLFKLNPDTYEAQYYLFKTPPQALTVKFTANGKGNVLLIWQDEDKLPYRLAWVYSEDFMETYNHPQLIEKEGGISIFEPIIFLGKPFVIYYNTVKNELILRDLLNKHEKVLVKLEERVTNLKVRNKYDRIYIAVQEGLKSIKVYELKGTFKLKKLKEFKEVSIGGEIYSLDRFIWNIYDFDLVNNEPIVVITAKFRHLPGVKVNSLKLPDRYNIFFSKGDKLYLLNSTKPFLITYTFPSIATDGKDWVAAYFGRKFIKGNVFLSLNGDTKKTDIAIENPSKETGFPKIININKNIYRILYPLREGNHVIMKVVDVDISKLNHYYKLPDKAQLKALLEKRVKEFIECQIKNDISCIMNYTDPFSRKIFKEVKKANIEILSYSCDKLIVMENSPLGVCEGYIRYKIKKGALPGINKDVERRLYTQDLWAFIDGEWYYVPPVPMIKYFLKW